MEANIKIASGKILIYRVFDVGYEINLSKAHDILKANTSASRFKLQKVSRAMVINNAPLSVSLGNSKLALPQHFSNIESTDIRSIVDIELSAKVWHFGVVSIVASIKLSEKISWDNLKHLSVFFENDQSVHNLLLEKTNELVTQINVNKVITNKNIPEIFEDYVIYYFDKLDGVEKNAYELFDKVDVYSLILSETSEQLSEQVKKSIKESAFQYSVRDLAIIDWNSAVVVEPTGSMDVPDVIEFALCQLLEMRYYDDVLDDKLSEMYNLAEQKSYGLFNDIYSGLAKNAGRQYLEISEVVESVENSLKIVGDYYLANIFRATSTRFRFRDWQLSVKNKLDNLAEFATLLHSQVNEKRAVLLEMTIIILIAIELIPLFKELFVG